jgi:hypothetical protein
VSSWRIPIGAGGARSIDAFAQGLAHLEVGTALDRNLDHLAGAWVAADPRGALAHDEVAEIAQLDPVAAGQRRRDLVEHRPEDTVHVALREVGVRLCQAPDEIRPGHLRRAIPSPAAADDRREGAPRTVPRAAASHAYTVLTPGLGLPHGIENSLVKKLRGAN